MTNKKNYTFFLTVLSLLIVSFSYGFTSPSNINTQTTVKADTSIIICNFPVVIDGTRIYEGILLDWTEVVKMMELQGNETEVFELEHTSGDLSFPFDFSTIISTDDIQTTSHIHRHPANGVNYYRLRGVEASGDYWYSDIIGISFDVSGNIFPNPVTSQTSIYINAPAEEAATLKVYDATGRLVHSRDIQLFKDFNIIGLHCSQWNRATYMVTVSGEQLGDEVIKLVKH